MTNLKKHSKESAGEGHTNDFHWKAGGQRNWGGASSKHLHFLSSKTQTEHEKLKLDGKEREFLKLLRRVKVAILNARFEDCNIFECRTSDIEHLTIMQTAL